MARGIYKIINVVNNKFYVGSAVDLKRRKTRHFSELRTGKHNNRYLQSSWDKHGEQAFVFVVVEPLTEQDDLLAAENVWLALHVGKEYCYNIGVNATAPMMGITGELSPTWGRKRTESELLAQNWKGKTHTEESKGKIRAYLLGKPKSSEVRAKISAKLSGEGNFWYGKQRPDHAEKVSKAVVATDAAGNITTYSSILALREALNIKPPTVNRALKSGKALTRGPYKNWLFKYA
jgi:group I intron endonuclease